MQKTPVLGNSQGAVPDSHNSYDHAFEEGLILIDKVIKKKSYNGKPQLPELPVFVKRKSIQRPDASSIVDMNMQYEAELESKPMFNNPFLHGPPLKDLAQETIYERIPFNTTTGTPKIVYRDPKVKRKRKTASPAVVSVDLDIIAPASTSRENQTIKLETISGRVKSVPLQKCSAKTLSKFNFSDYENATSFPEMRLDNYQYLRHREKSNQSYSKRGVTASWDACADPSTEIQLHYIDDEGQLINHHPIPPHSRQPKNSPEPQYFEPSLENIAQKIFSKAPLSRHKLIIMQKRLEKLKTVGFFCKEEQRTQCESTKAEKPTKNILYPLPIKQASLSINDTPKRSTVYAEYMNNLQNNELKGGTNRNPRKQACKLGSLPMLYSTENRIKTTVLVTSPENNTHSLKLNSRDHLRKKPNQLVNQRDTAHTQSAKKEKKPRKPATMAEDENVEEILLHSLHSSLQKAFLVAAETVVGCIRLAQSQVKTWITRRKYIYTQDSIRVIQRTYRARLARLALAKVLVAKRKGRPSFQQLRELKNKVENCVIKDNGDYLNKPKTSSFDIYAQDFDPVKVRFKNYLSKKRESSISPDVASLDSSFYSINESNEDLVTVNIASWKLFARKYEVISLALTHYEILNKSPTEICEDELDSMEQTLSQFEAIYPIGETLSKQCRRLLEVIPVILDFLETGVMKKLLVVLTKI